MAAEEEAEPSALDAEDGVAPSTSAPAPQQPPLAPATSVGQALNTVHAAKAAAAARALQTRAETLSTCQLVAPQAASPQQATSSTALTAIQVNSNLEAQAEADMGAMRQNMARLQDMLRQMQEQQQAYEAARQAKVASAPILQYSAGYIPTQAYPQAPIQALLSQVMQAPANFAGQPSAATVHPTPHVQLQVRPVATQVRPPRPGQMSQAMAEGASALQAQLQAFLQQLKPTPQHFRSNPFGPTGGDHKSRCIQLATVEPAWSRGFAMESRTAVRLQQRHSSTNHPTTCTDTRLRNKPGRHGIDPAFVRPIHGGTPSIAVRSQAAEHYGPTARTSHDFTLRHAISK
jgi:hypothetical protein